MFFGFKWVFILMLGTWCCDALRWIPDKGGDIEVSPGQKSPAEPEHVPPRPSIPKVDFANITNHDILMAAAFGKVVYSPSPDERTAPAVQANSESCRILSEPYVIQLTQVAVRRLIREQLAFETLRILRGLMPKKEMDVALSIMRSMADDYRLILPSIPDILLKTEFHMSDNAESARFYATSSFKRAYTVTRPTGAPKSKSICSDDLFVDTEYSPIIGDDLHTNENRDVAFDYEMMWDAGDSQCGAEFELTNGFRLRDHGPLDGHGYSPHSEKNINMSEIVHQRWYRRTWRLNSLSFDIHLTAGAHVYKASPSSSFYMNTMILSAFSAERSRRTSIAYFKHIRFQEMIADCDMEDSRRLLALVGRSIHRRGFDPKGFFITHALRVGVARPFIPHEDGVVARYLEGDVASPISGEPLSPKLDYAGNFSEVLSGILDEKLRDDFIRLREGKGTRKGVGSDSSVCSLFSHDETGALGRERFGCPLSVLPVLSLPEFISTFPGHLDMLCVGEQTMLTQAAPGYHVVSLLDSSSVRMSVAPTFDSISYFSRRTHIFREVNGDEYPLPAVYVGDHSLLMDLLQELTSPRYGWLLQDIVWLIRAAAGNRDALRRSRVHDPFSMADEFNSPNSSSKKSGIERPMYGIPLFTEFSWRSNATRNILVQGHRRHFIKSSHREVQPAGRFVVSIPQLIQRFIAQYERRAPHGDLSDTLLNSTAFIRSTALLLFDMRREFVDSCVASMNDNVTTDMCSISIVFGGTKADGVRIVRSIIFHKASTSFTHLHKLPVFPLLLSAPVRPAISRNDQRFWKEPFANARAFVHVGGFVRGFLTDTEGELHQEEV